MARLFLRNLIQKTETMDLSSGLPLSLIKNGLPFDYAPMENDQKTDVLILGGGITGALAAHYLSEAGIDCIVIDKRTIGLGSTCASTSLLQYEIDTPLHKLQHQVGLQNAVKSYQLCADAIDKLEGISAQIKFTEFKKMSSLYFGVFKKDIPFLKEEFEIRKKHGFEVKLLSQKEVNDYASIDAPLAILSSKAAQTNAYTLTHALLQEAKKKGIKIFDRTNITNIKHQKDKVVLASENGFTVSAKLLVYANGYEAVNHIDKKVLDLQSTYAICSEQGNADEAIFKNKFIMWNTADPYLYLRTSSDNRILIGGRDEEFYNPKKRDELLSKKAKQLENDFKKLYPEIRFKKEFSWCGTFGSTKDGLPYIGNYKKLPNSFFALGYGGNGITFSVIASEILRDKILGKKNEDEKIFSFER